MTQLAAMFLDAYRELNARKMFWVSLVISGLVVSVLLLLGVTEDQHVKILWWETPIPLMPEVTLVDLLKGTFVNFGVAVWLSWAAMILALISTASIFPDFVSSGSIDLLLSKPISRARLFILKYLSGLLFVGLQVTAFSLVAFIIIGIRASAWEWGLFIAIPLMVIFFSYLFCVSALVGIITRSTLAALLLTLLFWLLLFGVNTADGLLMMPRTMSELHVQKLQQRIDGESAKANANQALVDTWQRQLGEAQEELDQWRRWHGLVLAVKTALPKTVDTTNLVERWLMQAANLPEDDEYEQQPMPFLTPEMRAAGVRSSDVIEHMDRTYRNRSVAWVLGTSLAFEGVVLILAGWIFSRRDF